jgi:opacity protein-like surface antigen
MGSTQLENNHFYLGGFGGVVAPLDLNSTQSGVAYRYIGQFFPGQTLPTDENYNLYVNVSGIQKSNSGGLVGAHFGYRCNKLIFEHKSSLAITPMFELEGFYLGTSLSGDLVNPILEPAVLRAEGTVSVTHSIPANTHRFNDSYRLNTGVLLINSVFDFNNQLTKQFVPYWGGGLGFSFNTLSQADSHQISPYNEEDINHFNSSNQTTTTVLSAQTKVGLHTEITNNLSIFAEYRYLYISPTSYTFGNTYYPGHHPDTSKWNVTLSSMNFQTGVFGINYIF